MSKLGQKNATKPLFYFFFFLYPEELEEETHI